MLTVSEKGLEAMEADYQGITEQIMRFENAVLPSCPHCQSDNTADVQVGVIGRTMKISAATTKFKLIPYGPKPGKYYCNNCKKYFGTADNIPGGFTLRPRDRSFQAFKDFFTGVSDAVGLKENKDELSEAQWLNIWRKFWNLPQDTRPEDVKE